VLRERCSTTSFAITVPSSPAATFGPAYYADDVSERFVEMILGMSWVDFVLKFHGFAMAGLKGVLVHLLSVPVLTTAIGVGKNHNERIVMMKAHCVRLIRVALRKSIWGAGFQ
jgi:hypothetical protein